MRPKTGNPIDRLRCMAKGVQFYRGSPLARRGGICLDNLAASVTRQPKYVTDKYIEFGGLLVLYGSGAPDRREAIEQHKGNWIAFDLGYWDRHGSFRVSVNAEHPTPELMRDYGERPCPFTLREDSDPNGHILLIGMGRKSRIWHHGYEQEMLRRARDAYPGKRIVYRPKPNNEAPPGIDCPHSRGGPIEQDLLGASLVVCNHSNVAIDACIAGVPVVCDGGAAQALYGNDISNPRTVSREQRMQFLQRLTWWQWSSSQIRHGEFWPWLEAVLYG